MRASQHRRAQGSRQFGLSIVELLVGVVIALFITAAGTTLLVTNLTENRRLLLEARLMQDLRAAADLVSRDLRRAGYWGAAGDGVWIAGATGVQTNPYTALTPTGAASSAATYRYSRGDENNAVASNEQFGVHLDAGAVELQLGASNWQALTDAGSVTITEFSVTPTLRTVDLGGFCAKPCPAGSGSTCPPQQQVRSLAVVISGRLIGDPSVKRSVRSEVRVRNDPIVGACAA